MCGHILCPPILCVLRLQDTGVEEKDDEDVEEE
jgi:hypothetical protein